MSDTERKAGRELDIAMATRVFGYRWKRDQNYRLGGSHHGEPVGKPFRFLVKPDSVFKDLPEWDGVEDAEIRDEFMPNLPAYSSDPAAMMRVVERMKSLGWLPDLCMKSDGWVVNAKRYILPANGDWNHAAFTSDFIQEIGDMLPEAVCRAALSAVEVPCK